jgi:hypothetical protein
MEGRVLSKAPAGQNKNTSLDDAAAAAPPKTSQTILVSSKMA